MELYIHKFALPLRHRFTISRGSLDVQETLVVELRDGQHRGFGEATANDYYGITFDNMWSTLESVRAAIEKHQLEDPAAMWHQLNDPLHCNRFAQCALDQAAHDLWGKQRGQPVYRLWGLEIDQLPLSNFTIGIADIDTMVAKMNEVPGWPVYKIKLGTPHDLEIVRKLRRYTESVFRVDANCGWTAEETIRNSRELRELKVEFIEQPLPAGQWEPMRQVYAESALPVIADESCLTAEDVERCQGHFHGINIKLVKCGGLTPARAMIEDARRREMQVMVGCMTESTVGISAIAQLLPLLDYVDMDGAMLLAEDIARGVRLEAGICVYPDENGCGVQLLEP